MKIAVRSVLKKGGVLRENNVTHTQENFGRPPIDSSDSLCKEFIHILEKAIDEMD